MWIAEHRQLIEKAESVLEVYSAYLFDKIEADLFKHGLNIEPHPSNIKKAKRLFYEDPARMYMIKQLVNIKSIYNPIIISGKGNIKINIIY